MVSWFTFGDGDGIFDLVALHPASDSATNRKSCETYDLKELNQVQVFMPVSYGQEITRPVTHFIIKYFVYICSELTTPWKTLCTHICVPPPVNSFSTRINNILGITTG